MLLLESFVYVSYRPLFYILFAFRTTLRLLYFWFPFVTTMFTLHTSPLFCCVHNIHLHNQTITYLKNLSSFLNKKIPLKSLMKSRVFKFSKNYIKKISKVNPINPPLPNSSTQSLPKILHHNPIAPPRAKDRSKIIHQGMIVRKGKQASPIINPCK